jgi:coenzyme F420 hydrogenase subunit beta
MCVATCSKQVLTWDGGDHPVLEERTKTVGYSTTPLDTCSFCEKFCEESCPRLDRWNPLEARVTVAARAKGPIESGATNDVIRSILTAGRSAGMLDGVVMLDLDPWELKPYARVASSVEEIVDSVGPQYLWAPVLNALNEAIFTRGMGNIAVVGSPCVAQAIRRIRKSAHPLLRPYREAIRLSVAVFCTGTYKPEFIDEILVKQMGIDKNQVKRLEVSQDGEQMSVILWDESIRSIPRQDAERYTLAGCGRCDDYLGESADLAIGALGVDADSSALIIRSRTGDVFVRNALQMNLLVTTKKVDAKVIQAAAEEKDRRKRARAFKDLRVLMLDALADPQKRSQAIQQFVRLYRTPARTSVQETPGSGCTGC